MIEVRWINKAAACGSCHVAASFELATRPSETVEITLPLCEECASKVAFDIRALEAEAADG